MVGILFLLPSLFLLQGWPRHRLPGRTAMRMANDDAFSRTDDFEMDIDVQSLMDFSDQMRELRSALGGALGVDGGKDGNVGENFAVYVENPEWLFLQAAYDIGVRTFATKSGAVLKDLSRVLPDDAKLWLMSKYNKKLAVRVKKMSALAAVAVQDPSHAEDLSGVIRDELKRRSERQLTRVSRSRKAFVEKARGGGGMQSVPVGVLLANGDADPTPVEEASGGDLPIVGLISREASTSAVLHTVNALGKKRTDAGSRAVVRIDAGEDGVGSFFADCKKAGVDIACVKWLIHVRELSESKAE